VDIRAVSYGAARLWQHVEPGFTAVAVWTERRPGKGEDADPLVLFQRSTGTGLLSVFDGVGGAGRASAGPAVDGVDRSQAWVASRHVRALVEEWFVGSPDIGLAQHIGARLGAGLVRPSRIRGSIQRPFPTTFAGLDFRVTGQEVRWDVLWAGDSRCYVAEPETGLQQLSRDDTDLTDALELLLQDPPMTNMISADRRFEINRWPGEALLPCVLVCATDGFFGYVDTPAQFEHVLWETLLSAQDSTHWAVLLAERVNSYTGDDASLAVAALGFSDFDAFRASFRHRAGAIRIKHVAREESWQLYRGAYERRLPGAERVIG
jgi:serine/threonine protein phosphatase PrpC